MTTFRDLLPTPVAPVLPQNLNVHILTDKRTIVDCRNCHYRADGDWHAATSAARVHDCAEYRVPDAEQRAADVARMAPPFAWIDGVVGGNW